MTSPYTPVSQLIGGVANNQAAPLPTLSNGLPNFLAAAAPPGVTSIWNIPSDISATPIWFDIGHKTEQEHPDTSNLAGIEKASKGQLGTVHSSYQIMASPQKIMAQFMAMSKNDLPRFIGFQQALASGVWGNVKVNGSFDPNTERALGNAMLQYVKLTQGAGVGISFSDYLMQSAQTATALAQQQAGATQNPITLTDPTAIRAAAQQAAQDALGAGLSESQLNHFVAQFQAAQTKAQTQVGGSVSSPDLSADAMAYAQKSNPEGYKQNQRQAFLDTLVNMFAPSGSQRPNMTPTPSVGGKQ